MGKRVHVAKRWSVAWSDTEAFNWKNEEFKELLSALNVTVYGDDYSDTWECLSTSFDKAIDFLKNHKKEIYNFDNEYEDVIKCDDGEIFLEGVYDGITNLMGDNDELTFFEQVDTLVTVMESFKKERAKNTTYMHFCAF